MAKKTYSKTHSNPKALANHVAKIKKRGGTVKSKNLGKYTKIVYKFGDDQLLMF